MKKNKTIIRSIETQVALCFVFFTSLSGLFLSFSKTAALDKVVNKINDVYEHNYYSNFQNPFLNPTML